MKNKPKEIVKIWRSRYLPNAELLHATYITHQFPKHAHDGFAIGVIEKGELGFYYRGANVVAGKGMVNLANSGEVHNGKAMTKDGWTYRMFYMKNKLLIDAASQITNQSQGALPYFSEGVLHSPQLASQLWQLHCALQMQTIEKLKAETDFLNILINLIQRHADASIDKQSRLLPSSQIKLICDLICDQYNQDMSLNDLAKAAHLSPYHFLRLFHKETGMPPHHYLIQYRIQKAREYIRQNYSLAQTALETGFSDQSHLTRHFKRIAGITPGQYRKIVQET